MSKSKANQFEKIHKSIRGLEKKTEKIRHKLDDSVEEYSEKELRYLDIYQEFTNHVFEDEDIYEVLMKYNFEDSKIKTELEKMIRDLQKGEEYKWQTIEKGKSIIIIFLYHNTTEKKDKQEEEPVEEFAASNKVPSKNADYYKGYYKSYGRRDYIQQHITEENTHDQDLYQEGQEYNSRVRRRGGGYRGRGNYGGYDYSRGTRGRDYQRRGKGRGYYSKYSEQDTYQEEIIDGGKLNMQHTEAEADTQINKRDKLISDQIIEENTYNNTPNFAQMEQKNMNEKGSQKGSIENEKVVEKVCIEQFLSCDNGVSKVPKAEQIMIQDPTHVFSTTTSQFEMVDKREKVKVEPKLFKILSCFPNINFEILSPPKPKFSICKEVNTFYTVAPSQSNSNKNLTQTAKSSSTNKPSTKKIDQQSIPQQQEYQSPYGMPPFFSMYQQPPVGGDAHNYSPYQPCIFIPSQSYFQQESNEGDSSMKGGMKGTFSGQSPNIGGMQSKPTGNESFGGHPQYMAYPPYYYYNQNPYGIPMSMSQGIGMEMPGYVGGYEKSKMKGNDDVSGSASNYYYGQYKQQQ